MAETILLVALCTSTGHTFCILGKKRKKVKKEDGMQRKETKASFCRQLLGMHRVIACGTLRFLAMWGTKIPA
jgi:hypothetical protein